MNSSLLERMDQLIDGELDDYAVTVLLQDCEQEPSGWRSLALRLVEARAVREALAEMMDTPLRPPTHPRRLSMRWQSLCGIACLLCLAFVAGRFVPGQTSVPIEPDPISRKHDDSSLPTADTTDGPSIVGIARIHHRVGTEPPVPIIAASDLDLSELLQQSPRVPDRVRRRYRNQGLAIEADRRVMSLELADGQRFAIPLDKLGVRFVGHEIL